MVTPGERGAGEYLVTDLFLDGWITQNKRFIEFELDESEAERNN